MLIIFFIVTIIITDQVLKQLIISNVNLYENIVIIPNLLNVTHIENKGAAFGILQDQRYLFLIFTVSIIAIFMYFIYLKKIKNKLFLTSAILIVGGGIGNAIDRIKLGHVIDYVKISFFSPVFNFADCCIMAGSILLFIYILYFKTEKQV